MDGRVKETIALLLGATRCHCSTLSNNKQTAQGQTQAGIGCRSPMWSSWQFPCKTSQRGRTETLQSGAETELGRRKSKEKEKPRKCPRKPSLNSPREKGMGFGGLGFLVQGLECLLAEALSSGVGQANQTPSSLGGRGGKICCDAYMLGYTGHSTHRA